MVTLYISNGFGVLISCSLQVIPLHLPPGDTSQERTVQIDGTSEQIEAAKQLVNEVISEVCLVAFICNFGYYVPRVFC